MGYGYYKSSYNFEKPRNFVRKFCDMLNFTFLFGFLAGLVIILPLVGRIGQVPGSAASVAIAILAVVIGLFHLRKGIRLTFWEAVILLLIAAFTMLVFISSNQSQLQFLFSPGLWSRRAELYVDAKLFSYLYYAGPSIVVAVMCVLIPGDREKLIRGLNWALLLGGCVAAFHVLTNAATLMADDYLVVRTYFLDPTRGYSLIAQGALMMMATAAALSLRHLWPTVAVFLFLTFWINRRTETLLIVAIVLCFYALRSLKTGSVRSSVVRAGFIFSVAIAAAVPLHNPGNIAYWSTLLGRSIDQRVEIAEEALSTPPQSRISGYSTTKNASKSVTLGGSIDQRFEIASKPVILGAGLGSFAAQGGKYLYPHNLAIETYIEVGPLAAVIFTLVVLLSIGLAAFGILKTPRFHASMIVSPAIATGLFLIAMKSGDIAYSGRLFFFCLLASHLPHATQWISADLRGSPCLNRA